MLTNKIDAKQLEYLMSHFNIMSRSISNYWDKLFSILNYWDWLFSNSFTWEASLSFHGVFG